MATPAEKVESIPAETKPVEPAKPETKAAAAKPVEPSKEGPAHDKPAEPPKEKEPPKDKPAEPAKEKPVDPPKQPEPAKEKPAEPVKEPAKEKPVDPPKPAAPKEKDEKHADPPKEKEAPKHVDPPKEKSESVKPKTRDRSPDSIKSSYSSGSLVQDYANLTIEDENATQAAAYNILVAKNKKLEQQISELEDQLFDVEEEVMTLQKKLVLAEEEIADVASLLQNRETRNEEDRRRLAERQSRYDEEVARLDEIDAERRAFDSRITVLEAEVEQSDFVQKKLDKSLQELEAARKNVAELIEKNSELVTLTERRAREIMDLEKHFTNNVAAQHVLHAKTVGDMEKLLQNERKRAQEALEYVRDTLKARIQGLELQLKSMDSTPDSRREKRKKERELKQTLREIDSGKEQSTRNARRIEALEKQLELIKPRFEALQVEKQHLESDHHKYTRELKTLHTQLNLVYSTNAKLNAQVPLEVLQTLEEGVKERETTNGAKTN